MTPLDDLMRKIPAFKEWVPMWARVGIFLFCIMVFQCSGGNLFGFGERDDGSHLADAGRYSHGRVCFIHRVNDGFSRFVSIEIPIPYADDLACRGDRTYRL